MAEITNAVGWPQQARDYIDEVKSEMRRVTWPNWTQVRATTAVVIAAVFLFAGYFFVVDFVVRSIIDRIINYFVSK
ncbi:MAG TPA: preprotein translocase subunit SecE [Bryobacteraceae bacterium]|jgi:preprotein translocase subunit SecE|nr:preprotein translocase subunit SecE [Bryobacteraceae bacterium]